MLEANKKYIVFGGSIDQKLCKVAPTILANVDDKAPVMTEEVFGPIISIFPIDDWKSVIPMIRAKFAYFILFCVCVCLRFQDI